jgi:hypothetical protein
LAEPVTGLSAELAQDAHGGPVATWWSDSSSSRLPGHNWTFCAYVDTNPEDRMNRLTSIRKATRVGFGLGVRYRTAYRSSARRIVAGSDLTSAVPSMVDHLRPST